MKHTLPFANTIQCGDCLTLLQQIEDNSIDLIITSPPYFNQRDYDGVGIGNEINIDNYIDALKDVFSECIRVISKTGSIIFNIGDKYINSSLALIPYRFAIHIIDYMNVFLVNDISWVKSNPTPRQYTKRLISSTEPFFHFVKTSDYFYNRSAFLKKKKETINQSNPSTKIGESYRKLISTSDLSKSQKKMAIAALKTVINDVKIGKLKSFRMKIKGIHAIPFGGQQGGRKTQIEKNGFTIIRIKGEPIKRDVIISPVETIKWNIHPAVFPENVIKELIILLSPKNGLVLDPYVGSGTVAVASKKLGRSYIGFDINSAYCDFAIKRLKNE